MQNVNKPYAIYIKPEGTTRWQRIKPEMFAGQIDAYKWLCEQPALIRKQAMDSGWHLRRVC
jgi:hypothetical protein